MCAVTSAFYTRTRDNTEPAYLRYQSEHTIYVGALEIESHFLTGVLAAFFRLQGSFPGRDFCGL